MSFYKNLLPSDIAVLNNAIPLLSSAWGPHAYPNCSGGLLRLGSPQDCTIWAHSRIIDTDWLNYENEGVKTFVDIIYKYVLEFNSNPKFGRMYLHRLHPGGIIPRHRDNSDQPYFSIIKRYQLFLNIPESIVIESAPLPSKNSILCFNHNEFHYYENKSNENLFFCVFDLFN